MDETKEAPWSADKEPVRVLMAFLREVKGHWTRLDAINWAEIDSENINTELYSTIRHIYHFLLSLDKLISNTDQYRHKVSSRFASDPELDRLSMITHDWAVVILAAKSLSELLMQKEISEQDFQDMRKFLKSRLSEMDNLARGADILLQRIEPN